MIVTGKRSRELIHKGVVRWTGLSISTSHRFGDLLLKAECFFRSQHGGRQNTSGPGSCSYLEHSSSTDCAFSFFFDLRPVVCLVCRHRISFQPFGVASILKRYLPGLSYDRDPKLPVLVQLLGKDDLLMARALLKQL